MSSIMIRKRDESPIQVGEYDYGNTSFDPNTIRFRKVLRQNSNQRAHIVSARSKRPVNTSSMII